MEDALEQFALRQRKVVERKLETGDVKFDHKNGRFVYVESNKEFDFDKKDEEVIEED